MKISKKTFFVKVAVTFFAVTFILLLSEYLYTAANHPETLVNFREKIQPKNLERSYLSQVLFNEPKNIITKAIYQKITPVILYRYLSRIEKNPYSDDCKPLCISYADSVKYLTLFEKQDINHAWPALSPGERSKLYFWMATISLWDPKKDTETSEYLTHAESYAGPTDEITYFYNDFEKLQGIKYNTDIKKYFDKKISDTDGLRSYQKVLYAKAAFNIADISKEPNDKIKYLDTAIKLNAWNEDYYLSLSSEYIKKNEAEIAKNILTKCIDNLGTDSQYCKQNLGELDSK